MRGAYIISSVVISILIQTLPEIWETSELFCTFGKKFSLKKLTVVINYKFDESV